MCLQLCPRPFEAHTLSPPLRRWPRVIDGHADVEVAGLGPASAGGLGNLGNLGVLGGDGGDFDDIAAAMKGRGPPPGFDAGAAMSRMGM